MSLNVTIIPCTATELEQQTGAETAEYLADPRYPDGRRKIYKASSQIPFEEGNINEQLQQELNLPTSAEAPLIRVILQQEDLDTESLIAVYFHFDDSESPTEDKLLSAVRKAMKTLVLFNLPEIKLNNTGFYSKSNFKTESKINCPIDKVIKFLKLFSKNPEKYNGVLGQLKLAKELGKANLGNLFSVASAFDLTEKLDWQKINLPYATIEKFQKKIEEPDAIERYSGTTGQLQMAEDLGKVHPGNLFTVASAFDLTEELNWQHINLPYDTIESAFDLETGKAKYLLQVEQPSQITLSSFKRLLNKLGINTDNPKYNKWLMETWNKPQLTNALGEIPDTTLNIPPQKLKQLATIILTLEESESIDKRGSSREAFRFDKQHLGELIEAIDPDLLYSKPSTVEGLAKWTQRLTSLKKETTPNIVFIEYEEANFLMKAALESHRELGTRS